MLERRTLCLGWGLQGGGWGATAGVTSNAYAKKPCKQLWKLMFGGLFGLAEFQVHCQKPKVKVINASKNKTRCMNGAQSLH